MTTATDATPDVPPGLARCRVCGRLFAVRADWTPPRCATCHRRGAAVGQDTPPPPRRAELVVPSCGGSSRDGSQWPRHRAKAREARGRRERALDKQRARQAADRTETPTR